MSPEQAKGRQVDKRADIWAFGVVLYEMLTGRQAFGGTDISETLAFVLTREIEWAALPAKTPASVRRMLRRCVTRDRKNRLADMSMARLEIDESEDRSDEPSAGTTPVGQSAIRQRPLAVAAVAAAIAGVVAGLTVWSLTRSEEVPERVGRFSLMAPGSEPVFLSNNYQDLALSPDGTRVVYLAGLATPSSALTVRALDQLTGEPLDATAASFSFNPFVSPDNEWVGFLDYATQTLLKVSILGGPAITLCNVGSPRLFGASWSEDDTIIFGTETASGLWRVPDGGGDPEELTTVDTEGGEMNHGWPEVLPGGRAVLFTVLTTNLDTAQIAVADLATGEHRVLVPGGHAPRYAASGHLVYAASGTLRAVAFDLDALEVVGNPVPVLEGVVTKSTGAANFDLAEDGSLVYVPGGAAAGSAERGLMWVDDAGQEEPLPPAPGPYRSVSLSPDGRRAALGTNAGENLDIWVAELERGSLTRVTTDAAPDTKPLWTPDGESVVYESLRDGTPALYRKAADGTGTAEQLFTFDGATEIAPFDWTPDGTALVVTVETQETASDIGLVTLEPPGSSSWEPLIQTDAGEFYPALSPDGRWLAYASNETGRSEVYVQRFPELGQRRPISLDGGYGPAWSADGQELFYFFTAGAGPLGMARVTIESDATTLTAGPPERLFDRNFYDQRGSHRKYDLLPDGRFLMITPGGDGGPGTSPSDVVVVQNWFSDLQARVPTGR